MATTNPPDSWFVEDPANITWGVEIDQSATLPEVGGNTIDFLAVAAAVDPLMESDWIPLEADREEFAWARVKSTSAAGGNNIKLFLDIYDVNRGFVATRIAHNAPALAAGVWENIGGSLVGSATAVWLRVRFGKTASAAFSAQFDHVIVQSGPARLNASLVAAPQAIPVGAWTTVLYDIAGGRGGFTYVAGTGIATALLPGRFAVSAAVEWTDPTPNRWMGIRLLRNGVEYRRGNTGGRPGAGAMVNFSQVLSADLPLGIGSTMEIQVFNNDGVGKTISNGAHLTFWDVHRIAPA